MFAWGQIRRSAAKPSFGALLRQAIADLRFELAVIGLLVLTIAAISFAGFILRDNLTIRTGGSVPFTDEWHSDSVLGGNSKVTSDNTRPLAWACDLGTQYSYPFCAYELVLDRNHDNRGLDFGRFQTIRLTVDYKGPADSLRLSLKNFDRRYSKPGHRETTKYNQIELPLHEGRQTVEAQLDDIKVADWWSLANRVPYSLRHTQFDNIVSIEIDTGNNAQPGRHAFRVEKVELQGSLLPVDQWYLGILGFWIILICLFTASRILGLQHDLRRRRLLEQVAQGEAMLARETARRDHLTGLYNRRGVTERYQQMLADGADRPMAIILADIDHFKAINDHFGHVQGDEVLASFADLLRKNVRETDLLARWGGEEFLLISPVSDAAEAIEIANKLRLIIADTDLAHGKLTASFGVHFCEHLPAKVRSEIGFADRALYAAKESGRNRVSLYEAPADASAPPA